MESVRRVRQRVRTSMSMCVPRLILLLMFSVSKLHCANALLVPLTNILMVRQSHESKLELNLDTSGVAQANY